jgi:hypothetical protein
MEPSQLKQLEVLKQLAKRSELTEEDARAWYELIEDVRKQADYYERELIRHLKYGWKLYWRQIAEVLGVESKQGAHQRWRRLAPKRLQ